MDKLESELFKKYGVTIIESEEIQRLLEDVAKRGLVDEKDIKPLPPMSATTLFEHICRMRRLFLIQDGFNLDDDVYEGFCSSSGAKSNTKMLNNVLSAYFEYEKLKKAPKKSRGYLNILVICFLAILAFFSYTPAPM
ncbi:hypothetical protein GINT2_001954 [Glugoides intestinalis]